MESILKMVRKLTLSFLATCVSICVNCGSLLSSTKFNHVMSVIHFLGFGSTAFKSKAAPPINEKPPDQVLITLFLFFTPFINELLTL